MPVVLQDGAEPRLNRMNDDLRVVFESGNRLACLDRALVLEVANIPHQVVHEGVTSAIVVPADWSAEAAAELRAYDEENPPRKPKPVRNVETHDPVPGLVGYVLTICLVAGMAGYAWFGKDWLMAGHVNGALVREGEFWRLFTGLTLHSGLRHLASNIVFGVFFGIFAGRLLGSGYAWLIIVIAAGVANLTNLMLLEPSHRSIGASTAVFAALGLIAGYVWSGKLMPHDEDRWMTRYGPIVGGLALLMFTGSGSVDPITGINNTDVGAHFFGFLMGFIAGMLAIRFGPLPEGGHHQRNAGIAALAIIIFSWIIALG